MAVSAVLLSGGPGHTMAAQAGDTRLGIKEAGFTLNDQPAFLLGISYYGALGAGDETIQQDLDEMQRRGFNWIRVWATWGAFDNEVSAVDAEGHAREPYLSKLQRLVAECDRRGMIVDVTLSRGNGITGPPRLQTLAAHCHAVETLAAALKPHRNWYLDLANERNLDDRVYTSFSDLRELRAAVRQLDPQRLVTASHAGDISREEVSEYVRTVEVDFLSPHRPRDAGSPRQTQAKTRELLGWMQALGRVAPVHYQEPFRRGFSEWDPSAEDFAADLRQALAGGAAGWCLHNGDQREQPDGRPRRSFDLREARLFERLDDEERAFLDQHLPKVLQEVLPGHKLTTQLTPAQ
ncbi:MAG: cellulase family glycosylhydrolase [Pirellulaceae bacterium]